jgi:hypothetical protein
MSQTVNVSKRLVGVEDILFDNGNNNDSRLFSVNGQTYVVTKLNARHIPLGMETKQLFGDDASTVSEALAYLKNNGGGGGSGGSALDQDTTVAFSAGSTAATKNAAINLQPKDLGGHTLSFKFYGEPVEHTETVVFKGFHNGKLVIYSDNNAATISDNSDFGSLIKIVDCDCEVRIENINFTASHCPNCILAVRSKAVYVNECVFTGNDIADASACKFELSGGIVSSCSYSYFSGGHEITTLDSAYQQLVLDTNGDNYPELTNGKIAQSVIPTNRTVSSASGSEVNLSPGETKIWASGFGTTNTLNLTNWSQTGEEYARIIISLPSSKTVSIVNSGNSVTTVQNIEANKKNYCIIENTNGTIRVYVYNKENR